MTEADKLARLVDTIRVLRLTPDDVVIVRLRGQVGPEEGRALSRYVRNALPGRKAILTTPDVEVTTSKAEAAS